MRLGLCVEQGVVKSKTRVSPLLQSESSPLLVERSSNVRCMPGVVLVLCIAAVVQVFTAGGGGRGGGGGYGTPDMHK